MKTKTADEEKDQVVAALFIVEVEASEDAVVDEHTDSILLGEVHRTLLDESQLE